MRNRSSDSRGGKVDGRDESRKWAGNHIPAASMCVWHTPPTPHPAWAAGQVAYKSGTAENPFCFSGFPLLFSGAYNCLRPFCGHTMFQFPPLHFESCSSQLLFSLTVFILPSHQGATKLDVQSHITNHKTGLGSIGEEAQLFFSLNVLELSCRLYYS